jgi:transketolase
MRKTFPVVVDQLMKKNKKIICLLGDIGIFSFQNIFKKYKNRIYNMSTMEQSMIGFGSGLSKAGFIPIIHTITPFLVLRALEQIKIDFVYNKLSCNIVSVGASNDYPTLGTTHHCFEDISILSNFKSINLFIPSNAKEFSHLLKKNYNSNFVNYFRISEKKILSTKVGNRYIKNKNKKNLIIIIGNAIDPKKIISNSFDIYYICSITNKINYKFAKPYKKIIIIEPYFGNILERLLRKKNLNKEIYTISYDETIIYKYGTKEEQDNHLNFDDKSILKKIEKYEKEWQDTKE